MFRKHSVVFLWICCLRTYHQMKKCRGQTKIFICFYLIHFFSSSEISRNFSHLGHILPVFLPIGLSSWKLSTWHEHMDHDELKGAAHVVSDICSYVHYAGRHEAYVRYNWQSTQASKQTFWLFISLSPNKQQIFPF